MAYDDKDEGRVFPTRTGVATGSANERTMLDVVGSGGIRTQNRDIVGADGNKGTVRLRTRGGHPEFVTEFEPADTRSEEEVYMDSGLVDLISVNPSDPRSAFPAPLYYGNIERSYASSKKLLGTIVPPSTASPNPPLDGVPGKSFNTDGNLSTKKVCAALCPASIFTGKGRLYVQAQYGAKTKLWKWNVDLPLSSPPRLIHDTSGFVMDTNTGVYRDDKNNHWLITVQSSGIQVCKLIRSTAVEPLVARLSDAGYAADWDKIEAYILAYSTPSATRYAISTTVPTTATMGYGWKFNWDGTKADIVHCVEGFPLHTSTHYRFTFFRNTGSGYSTEESRWTTALSIVEGPTTWHNNYTGECLTYPLWATYELLKFGTKGGASSGTGAPVYCFYKRNDIEVFRYQSNGGGRWFPDTNIPKYKNVTNPSSFGLDNDWSVTAFGPLAFGTIGADGGTAETRMTLDKPLTAGFSCSGANAVATTHSYSFDRYTAGTKNFHTLEDAYGEYTGFVGDIYDNINRPIYTRGLWATGSDGVPCYSGGSSTPSGTTFLGNGYYGTVPSTKVSFATTNTSGTHSEGADVNLIIPFNDAQAAYMRAVRSEYEHEEGDGGLYDTNTSQWGHWWHIMQTADQGLTYYEVSRGFIEAAYSGTQGWHTGHYLINNTTANTYTVLCSSLVTSDGVFDFTPPESMSQFQNGATATVPLTYTTQSSTLGAVYGHGSKNLEGFPDIFPNEPPPFIGWA